MSAELSFSYVLILKDSFSYFESWSYRSGRDKQGSEQKERHLKDTAPLAESNTSDPRNFPDLCVLTESFIIHPVILVNPLR